MDTDNLPNKRRLNFRNRSVRRERLYDHGLSLHPRRVSLWLAIRSQSFLNYCLTRSEAWDDDEFTLTHRCEHPS